MELILLDNPNWAEVLDVILINNKPHTTNNRHPDRALWLDQGIRKVLTWLDLNKCRNRCAHILLKQNSQSLKPYPGQPDRPLTVVGWPSSRLPAYINGRIDPLLLNPEITTASIRFYLCRSDRSARAPLAGWHIILKTRDFRQPRSA